jgi:periplasmic divalent cation tolerance protein
MGHDYPIRMVYITTRDEEEARHIGRVMVEERLAACANIVPGMSSIYRWEGKIVDEREALLILKTHHRHVDRIISRVKQLHSYSCPCILAYKADAGNPAYVKWVLNETI